MALDLNFLFQYLKKEKIAVDQNEFKFQVESHSNYPSLLSISDTLSFFKINNLATNLNTQDIVHLPDTFIALLQHKIEDSFLTFIERTKNGFRYFENGKQTHVSHEKFEELFKNVVLLAEKEENESIAKKSNHLFIYGTIFLGLIYIISILTTDYSLQTIFFVIFAMLGVYLSREAISHEFGIKTKFSEAVCTLTTNTDCAAVINAKKSKFLTFFSFSDAGMAFFSAQLVGLLLFSVSNQLGIYYNIATLLLCLSLPITLLSFYQQFFVAKKWCPICLAIIGLIYLELTFLLFYNSLNFNIDIKALFPFSITLVGSYLATVFVKNTIKNNLELQSEIAKNNRFKRSYSLFKMALLASDKIENKTLVSGNILLGNPEAHLKIVVVSSPFCGHCKEAHKIIEDILDRFPDRVCFDMRFNFNMEKNDEKSMRTHQKLVRIYFDEGQDSFKKAIHNWFENKDETQLISKEASSINDLKINELLYEQFTQNQENSINYTPAIIINNYLFPKEYDRNDLIYFISELEEDENF